MHRPGRLSVTGSTSSGPYMMDRYSNGYALIGSTSGTTSWTVEVTGDDLQAGETATWQDHAVLAGIVGNGKGNLEFIPTAIRLTNVGTGSVQLDIIPKVG